MVAASVLNTVVSDYVFRTANRGSVRHTIPRLAAAELAPNEEDPRNHHKGSSSAGALYRDALSKRRLSYRQLALIDLGAIPRNLTRASPWHRVFVFRTPPDCRGITKV